MRSLTVVFLTIFAAASVWSQTSSTTRKSTGSQTSAALTPDQQEAQEHFKIATRALADNNLEIAGRELEEAARLDPKNAVIWYNLAVVR